MMWHLSQAQDYQAMIEVLLSNSESEIHAGHAQSVRNWLDALPLELLKAQPDLLLLKAQVLSAVGAYNEAYELLDQTQKLLMTQLPGEELKLAQTVVLRGRMLRAETRYQLAVQTLQEGLAMLQALPDFSDYLNTLAPPEPSRPAGSGEVKSPASTPFIITLAQAYLELGICQGMESQLSQAQENLHAARVIYEGLNFKEQLAHIHHCLSLVYDGLNDNRARQQQLEISLHYWQAVENLPGLTNTLINLADLHLSNANYAQAETILEQALQQAEKAGYQVGRAYVLAFKGDLCRDKNDFVQAYRFYQQAEELAESCNEKRLVILVCREITAIQRVLSHHAEARATLNRAFQALSPQQRTSGFIFEVLQLLQIGLELDDNNFTKARALLESSSNFFNETENKRELSIKRFLDARLLFGLARPKAALEALVNALTYAAEQGLQPVLKQEAFHSVPLLKLAQAKLTRQPQIQELIERLLGTINTYKAAELSAAETSELGADAALVETVSRKPILIRPEIRGTAPSSEVALVVRGFGNQEVLVHGTPVRDWRTAKACEMLFLLLDRGKPMQKEVLMDALWPDLELDRADSLFKSTVYRLRNAISPDWIKRNGGAYSLEVPYWYDVQQFENLSRLGDTSYDSSHQDRSRNTQALTFYREATALYRGDFMEGNYSDWCTERQGQLANRYTETLLKQARLELQLDQPDGALQSIEQCLSLDKCNDAAHLLRLQIYQQQANLSMITLSYVNYCNLLKQELGLEPSAEIKTFYLRCQKQLLDPTLAR